MSGARQLTLAVGLRDDCTFDSFLPTVNAEALAAVQSLLAGGQRFVYLYGEPGTGRSHLLEAAADAASREGRAVAWVALSAPDASPALLEGLAGAADLVCLDDIDRIAGNRLWEEAIFHLFNDIRAAGGALLASASATPALAGFRLPDLASRMASGLAVATRPLDDEARLAVLAFRAARRGYELPPETGQYLLARSSRRLDDLVGLLTRLEQASLTHQRRLTVPFVRDWLKAPPEA